MKTRKKDIIKGQEIRQAKNFKLFLNTYYVSNLNSLHMVFQKKRIEN